MNTVKKTAKKHFRLRDRLKANGVLKALVQPDPYAVPFRSCLMTVQDTVPIHAVHVEENLIESYPGMFSRSYALKETNYQTETEESEKSMFVVLRGILNSIGINCEISFMILNRAIEEKEFRDQVHMPECGDFLDPYRVETNAIMDSRIREGRNGIEKVKIVTLGFHTSDVKKACDPDRNPPVGKLRRGRHASFGG